MNEQTNHEETNMLNESETVVGEATDEDSGFDEAIFTEALFGENDAYMEDEKREEEKSNLESDNKTALSDKEKNEIYTVKYNGEEKRLTLDELKTNAQKGLNYDRIKEKFDRLKNSPAIKALNAVAKENEMGVEEYAQRVIEIHDKKREGEFVKMGVSEREAKKIVRLEALERERLFEKEANRPFDEFVSQYPDVDPKDIDKSVWEEFAETNNLVAAYAKFENRELKNKLKILEQNSLNKDRSIGSAKGNSAAFHDAFLEGLYS